MKKGSIRHIAQLAHIPLTSTEEKGLEEAFDKTIDTINTLQQMDTSDVPPTNHVGKQINVFREDNVDEERMLSQDEALQNAPETYNGMFVVNQLIAQED